jgi:hypothetical protein
MRNQSDERAMLLNLIDRSYDVQSWHGPNLKGSLRGLGGDAAAWRPSPGRHAIAEIVLHAAYWKYTVRRRLLELPRGSFCMPGSNWFALPEGFDDRTWKQWRGVLESEHRLLRQAIEEFDLARLQEHPRGSKFSYLDTIIGIAQHDVYHAGQIQNLKRQMANDA